MSGLICASEGTPLGLTAFQKGSPFTLWAYKGEVGPSLGALQLIGALHDKRLRGAGGFSRGRLAGRGRHQLASGLRRAKAA